MTVYVLHCRAVALPGELPNPTSHYYVGWTENFERRLREHRGELRGRNNAFLGAAFMRSYYPQEVVERRPGTLATETEVTLEYMRRYGVEAVRGGIYHQPELSAAQLAEIAERLAQKSE